MAEKPSIEILRKIARTSWQPDVGDVTRTWVHYRTEIGRMDLVIVPGADPTDEEIIAAIKKRREEKPKPKTYKIPI